MSRRMPSSHRRKPSHSESYHYQGSTLPLHSSNYCHENTTNTNKRNHNSHTQSQYRRSYNGATTADTGLSDDNFTDITYYEYYQDPIQQGRHGMESRTTDYNQTLSDDSGSMRLPLYQNESSDSRSPTRPSRQFPLERNSFRMSQANGRDRVNPQIHQAKDLRRVYPNENSEVWSRLYHEIPTPPCDPATIPTINNVRRLNVQNQERPLSSQSSGVTSAIVDGCGGKCQTFENVCYFFLQLVFTMGILIGVSLCIAGLVLRKSASRNLQVLIYIGVLVALVSMLLLGIQCNARNTAKKRKKALRMAKQRAPIPMEVMHMRSNAGQPSAHAQQQAVMIAQMQGNGVQHRVIQMAPAHRPLPPKPPDTVDFVEQPGIPWWKREMQNV